jgi:WD40 repeat protein
MGASSGGMWSQIRIHTRIAFDRAWVEHLAWRPQKSVSAERPALLAAAAGRNLRLLRPDGSVHHTFPIAPKSISALAWSPFGSPLGGRLLSEESASGMPTASTAFKEFAYSNSIHKLAWSGDGKWLVSGNQDPSVHLWIPESGFEFHMSGYEGKVQEVCFDHTGRWLATSGGSEGCVWDCQGNGPEGREPAMLPHEAKTLRSRISKWHTGSSQPEARTAWSGSGAPSDPARFARPSSSPAR